MNYPPNPEATQPHPPKTEEQPKQKEEIIISVIDDINHPGIANIAHWSIVVTNLGVYFFNMGKDYNRLGSKNLMDTHKILGTQRKPEIMGRFTAAAKDHYFIDKDNLSAISATKGWFKNTLTFEAFGKKISFSAETYALRKFAEAISILHHYAR